MTSEERILVLALYRFLTETLDDLDDEDFAYMTVGDAVDEVAKRGKLPEHPERYGRAIELAEDMLMTAASRVPLPGMYASRVVNWHTSTSADTHAALAQDEDWHVRIAVAENPRAPADVLLTLARDEHLWVRREVARNTSAPADALAVLAQDEDVHVRFAVARHTSTPGDVLTTLAQDAYDYIRSEVAQNTSTPNEVLAILAGDIEVEVREAARESLARRRRR